MRSGWSAQEAARFRHKLGGWYRVHARRLPWRGVTDPYRIWLSEVMLQQTRVATVITRYAEFLGCFPTLASLAEAEEAEVLAAWSGLGYYRRARMLHRAARFVMEERGGVLPGTSAELRTLPGIGEYTCAAIASIAFGESIAVVDGNVERVLLRVAGRPEERTAAGRAFVRDLAGRLVPRRGVREGRNAAGDHNQAMMELGATICLPKAPLCLQCPVFALCRTRGEHVTVPRERQRHRAAAYLLCVRGSGASREVLLERRDAEASLMAGMLELPGLPVDAAEGREPVLRVRHSITKTNYSVEVYSAEGGEEQRLRGAVAARDEACQWVRTEALGEVALTGLARKVLQRLGVMAVRGWSETMERVEGRVDG